MEKVLIDAVEILLPVLISLLAVLLSLVLAEVRNLLAQKVGAEKASAIERLADSAVLAAQQYLSTADGQAKKAYALAYLQAALDARGIKIDAAQLSVLIEATLARAKEYSTLWPTKNMPPANDLPAPLAQ